MEYSTWDAKQKNPESVLKPYQNKKSAWRKYLWGPILGSLSQHMWIFFLLPFFLFFLKKFFEVT